jgi:bifunctional N-acetylglucosamine-1-phosphate-uridyltransferase/glucosamine-1-phosphate-acetyltransferase GlmU-like protein
LTSVVVIVAATWPPLVGSSVPAALERFCGQRLLDRALALVGELADAAPPIVAADQPIDVAGPATTYRTQSTDLHALLRDLPAQEPGCIGLAVDPCYPLLTAATLRALVAAARSRQHAVAGHSPATLAAVAVPLPLPATGLRVDSTVTLFPTLSRVDDKKTLVELERRAYLDRAHELLAAGLLVRDPETTRIEGPVSFGVDVEIEPGCTLRGPIALGDRVRIGSCCILTRVTIGDDTEIRPFTMMEDASVGDHSFVGPYARVRPHTAVGPRAQIGNFVEIKEARLGRGNRINHLAFVGNATFGDHVTLGAGSITCNHDGVRSQPTTIGAGAYVGSGCVLVAPIAIGEGATIGAGSTITRDAPPDKLTLARNRQVVVESWQGFEAKPK